MRRNFLGLPKKYDSTFRWASSKDFVCEINASSLEQQSIANITSRKTWDSLCHDVSQYELNERYIKLQPGFCSTLSCKINKLATYGLGQAEFKQEFVEVFTTT